MTVIIANGIYENIASVVASVGTFIASEPVAALTYTVPVAPISVDT